MVCTRSQLDASAGNRRSRLLVVEGDVQIQRLVSEELKADYLEMNLEESIDKAERRILEAAPFDAILIDLFDPVERCYSLISFLKERSPTTEIVFISRLGNKHLWIETIQRDAADVSPLDRNELRRTVINALEKATSSSGIRKQRSYNSNL